MMTHIIIRRLASLGGLAAVRALSSTHALFPASAASARRNADDQAVFIVTGASRGIGSEYCLQLLARTRGKIIACCRTEPRDDRLLQAAGERLSFVELDVTNDESIRTFPERIACDRVDLLINNVGVLHDDTNKPERSIAQIDPSWARRSFDTNCLGALLTTQALSKQLRTTKDSLVINMSARVGSISDNRLGGWYSYRISKAALNQATKTMALEFKRYGTTVIALHPGTTNTDLSKPFQANVIPEKLFDVEFSVSQLLTIIDGLETQKHSGGFFAWDGSPIPF